MRLACVIVVLGVALVAAAGDKKQYQHGTLVDITDTTSNRTVGNGGQVVSVEDVDYRISIRVDDMVYVGSYSPRFRWSYEPKGWVVNDPIEVRVEGKNMYLRRPDGKELKTEIVKKVREQQH